MASFSHFLLLLVFWCEKSYVYHVIAQETPAYTAESYPEWRSDACTHGQREPDIKWICDPDGMFQIDELQQLSNLMEEIYTETDCPCASSVCDQNSNGYVVLVAAMKRISEGPESNEQGINAARTFAMDLLSRNWKVNEIRCSEEILVIYAARDTSPLLYTMTGMTAMAKLPNNLLTRFSLGSLGNLVSNKTDGKFLGMEQLLIKYRETLNGNFVPTPYKPQYQPVVGEGGQEGVLSSLALCLTSVCFWFFITRLQ